MQQIQNDARSWALEASNGGRAERLLNAFNVLEDGLFKLSVYEDGRHIIQLGDQMLLALHTTVASMTWEDRTVHISGVAQRREERIYLSSKNRRFSLLLHFY